MLEGSCRASHELQVSGLRLRRSKVQSAIAVAVRAATPPMTPPAIAPASNMYDRAANLTKYQTLKENETQAERQLSRYIRTWRRMCLQIAECAPCQQEMCASYCECARQSCRDQRNDMVRIALPNDSGLPKPWQLCLTCSRCYLAEQRTPRCSVQADHPSRHPFLVAHQSSFSSSATRGSSIHLLAPSLPPCHLGQDSSILANRSSQTPVPLQDEPHARITQLHRTLASARPGQQAVTLHISCSFTHLRLFVTRNLSKTAVYM